LYLISDEHDLSSEGSARDDWSDGRPDSARGDTSRGTDQWSDYRLHNDRDDDVIDGRRKQQDRREDQRDDRLDDRGGRSNEIGARQGERDAINRQPSPSGRYEIDDRGDSWKDTRVRQRESSPPPPDSRFQAPAARSPRPIIPASEFNLEIYTLFNFF
jgi:hypothetical protein